MSPDRQAVLLVEGDIVIRHPLAEYLRSCGFTVLEAATGDEARTIISSDSVKISVVLADMTTAGSGFALRQWVLERGDDVQVILAGSTEKAVQQAGDLCKDGPALTKPWDHRLVLDEIKRGLARRDRQ